MLSIADEYASTQLIVSDESQSVFHHRYTGVRWRRLLTTILAITCIVIASQCIMLLIAFRQFTHTPIRPLRSSNVIEHHIRSDVSISNEEIMMMNTRAPSASAIEVWSANRRNRWVLESLQFFHVLLNNEKLLQKWTTPSTKTTSKYCIVVLTNQRTIPFELMFVASLMRGNQQQRLLQQTELHVLNCERRQNKEQYSQMNMLRRIPFVNVHHMPERAGHPGESYQRLVDNQYDDYRDAITICRESRAQWGLVFEADAYLTHGFLDWLDTMLDSLNQNTIGYVSLYQPTKVKTPPEMTAMYDDTARFGLSTSVTYTLKLDIYVCHGNIGKAFPLATSQRALNFLSAHANDGIPIDCLLPCEYLRNETLRGGHVSPSLVQHSGQGVSTHGMQPNTMTYLDYGFIEKPRVDWSIVSSYRGCYEDLPTRRAMTLLSNRSDMAIESCRVICKRHTFEYAGLQNGGECWCDNDYTLYGISSSCDFPCSTKPMQICGGLNALSVYAVEGNLVDEHDVVRHNTSRARAPLTSVQ